MFTQQPTNTPASAATGASPAPFFQAKLSVNTPGDAYEQEADRVADSVMAGQTVQLRQGTASNPVQTKCASCEAAEHKKEEEELPVQRKCDDCEHENPEEQNAPTSTAGMVQMKCSACAEKERQISRKDHGDSGVRTAPDSVTSVLQQSSQETLPASTRSLMEHRMGYDFSQVSIHNNSQAAESASAIQARAYTHGNQIVFGSNQYQPGTPQGDRLIAHELTHVVQQSSNIQRSSLWGDIVSQSDWCNPDKKEAATPAEATEEKSGNNFTPGMGLCEITPDQPETPPENTPAPTEGEATQVSVEEKADVATRQQSAPNPSKDAPSGDSNMGENIEKNTSLKDMLCPPEEKTTAEAPAEKQKRRAAPQPPQPKAEGNKAPSDNATEQSEQLSGAQATEKSAEQSNNKDGKSTTKEQVTDPNTTIAESLVSVQQNAALGVFFDTSAVNQEDEEAVKEAEDFNAENNLVANQMLGNITEQASGIANQYFQLQQQIETEVNALATTLQADIDVEVENTTTHFKDLKAEAKKQVRTAINSIKDKQKSAIAALSAGKLAALTDLNNSLTVKSKELSEAGQTALNTLSTNYSNGVKEVNTAGTDFSNQAVSRAEVHADAYAVAQNGTPHQQYLVVNEESDGILDGKLTYKRFMARRDAARNVGKQFGEGFVSQAREIAMQLLCGKGKDQEIIGETTRSGFEAQTCLYDKALSNINTEYQTESAKINTAAQESIQQMNDVLRVSLKELDSEEQKQIETLRSFGAGKARMLKETAKSRQQVLSTHTIETLSGLNDFIDQYRNSTWTNGPVNPNSFKDQTNWLLVLSNLNTQTKNAQLNSSSHEIIADLNQQKTAATLQAGLIHLLGALSITVKWSTIDASVKDTTRTIRGELNNFQKQGEDKIKQAGQKGTNDLGAVVTGVNSLYGKITGGVTTTFSDTTRDIRNGFQKTLNNDLDKKICQEAEAAAKKVKPRWKKILAVVLIVLVVVIVLVVAPGLIAAIGSAAASLAGSLGAATALATTIGAWVGPIVGGAILGALSQVTIQVGNNALDGVKLTTGLKEAAITGAIGGALGGLGGQVASVWAGRAATTGMQMAQKIGTEAIFDLGGSILGDLAVGNEISLTNIAVGMAFGGAIQGGVKVGGMAGTKVKMNKPDSVAGKLINKFEKFQLRSVEMGEQLGSKLAFGPRAKTQTPNATSIADDTVVDTPTAASTTTKDSTVPVDENLAVKSTDTNATQPEQLTPKSTDNAINDSAVKPDGTDIAHPPTTNHEQKGDFSTSAENRHHISEGPGGLIRCSPSCTYMKDRYRVELRNPNNAHLKAEFDKISAMPKGKAKTEAAAKLSKKLNDVVESGEISHKRWDDPKLTKEEFYDDYVTKFPDTTLTQKDINAYYKQGYRLNPQTGKFKNPSTGAEADFTATITPKDTFDPSNVSSDNGKHVKKLITKRKKLLSERDATTTDEDYYAKNKEVIDTTESIGNTASDMYMVDHLGYRPEYTGTGNYTVDKVYFKDGVYHVIEVKGGSSTLGTKLGKGEFEGKVLQQGTPEYLKQTISEMKVSQDIATVKMGIKLEKALKSGKLKYGLIQQKLDGGGNLVDTRISDFQL
jgi:Domain of unknown function (DUF4157)